MKKMTDNCLMRAKDNEVSVSGWYGGAPRSHMSRGVWRLGPTYSIENSSNCFQNCGEPQFEFRSEVFALRGSCLNRV